MKQNRILRLSKVLAVFLFLCFGVACLILLLGFSTLFFKKSSFHIQPNVPTGIVFFNVAIGRPNEMSATAKQIAAVLTMLLTLPPWMALYYQAGSYFSLLSEGTSPFAAPLIKKMRLVNLLLYISAILPVFVWPMLQWAFSGRLELSLVLSDTLFMAIILTILIEIFRYGAELQHEIEETV